MTAISLWHCYAFDLREIDGRFTLTPIEGGSHD